MSVNIHEVLDYLDTHPAYRQVKDMGGLLVLLHDAFNMHNCIDSEEIQSLFRQMREIFDRLSMDESDRVFNQVCQLCWEHEQLAFSQGVLVGMLLMTEVNALP